VQRIGTKDGWAKLKSRAIAKSEAKMVETIAKDIAKKSTKIDDVADKLLDKISALLDDFGLIDNTQSIKHLTSALKDIKDIKGLKSDIDLREQEARIDKLRKDAMEEDRDKKVEVVIGEEVEDYAN
jgi:hypothetical protein